MNASEEEGELNSQEGKVVPRILSEEGLKEYFRGGGIKRNQG